MYYPHPSGSPESASSPVNPYGHLSPTTARTAMRSDSPGHFVPVAAIPEHLPHQYAPGPTVSPSLGSGPLGSGGAFVASPSPPAGDPASGAAIQRPVAQRPGAFRSVKAGEAPRFAAAQSLSGPHPLQQQQQQQQQQPQLSHQAQQQHHHHHHHHHLQQQQQQGGPTFAQPLPPGASGAYHHHLHHMAAPSMHPVAPPPTHGVPTGFGNGGEPPPAHLFRTGGAAPTGSPPM